MTEPTGTEPRLYRCARCDFTSSDDTTIREHAWVNPHHPRCVICTRSLTDTERQTCGRCVGRCRADLADILDAYTRLPATVGASGWHRLNIDALAFEADGSIEGGGPDDWPTDPTPVIAVLESNERDWRHSFGHPPAESIATVSGCVAYLQRHLDRAAAELPQFDDYVNEIRSLRSRLMHVVGTANDPMEAKWRHTNCGGKLVRRYDTHGLDDDWTCLRCDATVTRSEYYFGLRVQVAEAKGFVPLDVAADEARRPFRVLMGWIANLEVTTLCRREDRRLLVSLEDVKRRATPKALREAS